MRWLVKFREIALVMAVFWASLSILSCVAPTLVSNGGKSNFSVKLLVNAPRAASSSPSGASDGRVLIASGANTLTVTLSSTTTSKTFEQVVSLGSGNSFVANFTGVPFDVYLLSAQLVNDATSEIAFQGSTNLTVSLTSATATLNMIPVSTSSNAMTAHIAGGLLNASVPASGYQTIYVAIPGPLSIVRPWQSSFTDNYTMFVQDSTGQTLYQESSFTANHLTNLTGPAYITFFDATNAGSGSAQINCLVGTYPSQISFSAPSSIGVGSTLNYNVSVTPSNAITTGLGGTIYSGPGGVSYGNLTGTFSSPSVGVAKIRVIDSATQIYGELTVNITAPDYYVSTSGSDSNDGLSFSTPFRTISKALIGALTGTTVYVQPGVYSSGEFFDSANTLGQGVKPLNIPSGVTLIGNQASKGSGTVIQGIGKATAGNSTLVYAMANVRISGFTMTNQDVTTNNPVGVYVAGSGVVIDNCTIEGNDYAGITVPNAGASNISIHDNVIQNNRQRGLYIGVSSVSVQKNAILNNEVGVALTGSNADLGGGGLLSTGGNTLANKIWNLSIGVYSVVATNNSWSPAPPAGILGTGSVTSAGATLFSSLTTYYVSTSGNDTSDGSPGTPFRTISRAVKGALPGTVINVAPGTYNTSSGEAFPITVPSGVSLIGDEPNKGAGVPATEINGEGYTVNGLTTYTSAVDLGSGATLAGIRVVNPRLVTPVTYSLCVRVIGDTATVRNCTILGPSTIVNCMGISVENISNGNFVSNAITNSLIGINFSGGTGTNNLVANNSITSNTYGIEFNTTNAADLGGGSRSGVGGNTFKNATYDFYSAASSGGTTIAKFNLWSTFTTITMAASFNSEKILLQNTSALDRSGGGVAP